MECPACQARIATYTTTCPRCGAALTAVRTTAESEIGIVEGTAERGPISAELPWTPEGDPGTERVQPTGLHMPGDTQLVVSRPSLPAVLWRQPAVRAVAQAGAGAVALTLGMRLVRAWLARPGVMRAAASSALPGVADLLRSVDTPSPAFGRAERGTEVAETFIYMRRVIRHR